jgi:hypothetical protein
MTMIGFGHHRRHHHHHHPHQILTYIVLTISSVDDVGIVLTRNQELIAMTDVTLGHTITFGISYLDQVGNPMIVTPVPSAPATWTNTTPSTETLVVDPTGNSAVATTLAVGTDVVNLSVMVGGTTFMATIGVNVTAVPQVLTSVAISATVS